MKSDWSWIGSVTTIEPALLMERASAPQASATAQPRLPRASAHVGTRVPIGMRVSPFFEFAVVARVTLSGAGEWARLPSAGGLLSGRDPKEVCRAFFAALCKLVLGGTDTPKGRAMPSRRPSAAGRRKAPKR